MMMISRPLKKVLQGSWDLRRRIVHSDGSLLGTVKAGARAEFMACDAEGNSLEEDVESEVGHLLYREDGVVTLPTGQDLMFHRLYLYKFVSATKAEVFFFKPEIADEHLKFFHQVSLDQEACSNAEHLCIQDLYKVNLKFENDDKFSMHWNVTGPAKDYEIFSEYSKM